MINNMINILMLINYVYMYGILSNNEAKNMTIM